MKEAVPTIKENANYMKSYNKTMFNQQICGCAACGIRDVSINILNEPNFVTLKFDEFNEVFEYNKLFNDLTNKCTLYRLQILETDTQHENDIKKNGITYVEYLSIKYMLYNEFIHYEDNKIINATFCNYCCNKIKEQKRPEYSLANGFDYGNINNLQLPKLSFFETLVISTVIIYSYVIKLITPSSINNSNTCDLRMSAIQGHVIAFIN